MRPRTARRRRVVGALGLAVLLVFSSEWVSNKLLYDLEHAAPSTFDPSVTYDAVVLLGGVVDERVVAQSGQPAYNENVERVIMTHRLLRDGKAKIAIVSGGPVDPSLLRFSEAHVLARQLEDWGIDASRVVIEDRARNTRENAVYAKEILEARGLRRVLVVTSAFHMRRALECFRAVGLEVDSFAVDYRAVAPSTSGASLLPRASFLSSSTSTIREIAGWMIYRLQGYAKA